MQNSTVAPTSLPSVGLRLLLAFLIGLLLGPNNFLPGSLQWAVPVIVLAIASLVSIVLDPDIRQSGLTSGRMIIAVLSMLLIGAIVLAGVGILLGELSNLMFVVFAVFPFLVGLLAAFIVGSNGTWILALGTGLAAWLGSSLLFSITNYIGFPLTFIWVIPSFGLAALGGLAGRFLRVWSLGRIVSHPLQMSATTSTWIRLLIAFALGLPTTLIFPFVKLPTPIWWRWEVPAGVLIVAMLLSILLSLGVRQRTIAPVRILLSFLVVLLLAGVIIVVEIIPRALLPQSGNSSLPLWLSIGLLMLIPFSVGLAAAFAVGSTGTWRFALGSALAAWLGAAIVNVIVSTLDYMAYRTGGDTDITYAFTLVAVAIAFGIAAPGGIVGRLLRNWLLQGG